MNADAPAPAKLLESAVAAHRTGKLDAAAEGYRRILAQDPTHFDARHLLGVLHHQAGRQAEAVQEITRALGIKGDVAEAHFNLAAALRPLKRPGEAIAALRRALALKPAYPEAELNLAVLLRQQGDLDAAGAAYKRALALKPDFALAHNNLASLLEVQGQFDAALVHWRRTIDLKPDFAEAYRNLAQHKASALTAADVTTMQRLLAEAKLPARDLVFLCFALFEVHETAGDSAAAFAALKRGNDLKRQMAPFNLAGETAVAESLMQAFSPEVLALGKTRGNPSPAPIFIVGMPRSGTSLVEQLLASHRDVFGGGEQIFIGQVAQPFLAKAGGRLRWHWDPKTVDLQALGAAYLAKLQGLAPAAPRVTDKMPNNAFFLGFIRTILPNAKILHLRRDPRDTCLACYKRLFDQGQNFSYDLTALGQYYRLYDRVMTHWHQAMPGAILDVAYEDLVADLPGQTVRLLEHCGLPWEAACLEFHRHGRAVKTASAAQVRQPIYSSAIGRWKKYEAYLHPLFEALGEV